MVRRSKRIAKNKPNCYCITPKKASQENVVIKRLQAIAIKIDDLVYHEGDIVYSEAINYLNIVESIKENQALDSKYMSLCSLLINQLNKIIEVMNISDVIKTTKINKPNAPIMENKIDSSQETYCAVLENCDTNELGADIQNTNQNSNKTISKTIIDVEDFIPYTIVPQNLLNKPIDLSSHKPNKSQNELNSTQPIDYSSKINTNVESNKPEVNSCPIFTSSKCEITNQSYSEQSVFRKPLNYKPKAHKNRRHVMQKPKVVHVSNETVKGDTKKLDTMKIDKTKLNKTNVRITNAIKKAKTLCSRIKKSREQFTIQYNVTPQNSQNPEMQLDTEETYNSEDCFDSAFADNEADTDESLMALHLKYKQLNINENTENTTILSEIEESTDWNIGSPIVELQPKPQENEEFAKKEKELQNKIHEIKSEENFKYNENESVVTNIRNYRKTFVRKILQLRDVMQETPIKHQFGQRVNTSLFKKGTNDDIIIRSQNICPQSPKNERYKDVERFVNRENESDDEFIKRLKDKSRELSKFSIQELLQQMDNYNRL